MSAPSPVKFSLTLLALLIGLATPVRAAQPDKGMSLFDLPDVSQPTTPSPRYTRPISKIAENTTVITAEQIALLNAHTLAEVLQTVSGVQLDVLQTPGGFTDFNIQGAFTGYSHILVLIDGVKQNNQIQGMGFPNLIPVQQIERVEIIKGAASGSWGQALGGVVNVVTKSPDSIRSIGGRISSSLGERGTNDNRGEVSGTIDRFGYYLSGGSLYSKGLLPNNGVNNNNGYAKFTYELPAKGNFTGGLSYMDSAIGLDENSLVHDNGTDQKFYAFLNFDYPIAEQLTLKLSGSASSYNDNTKLGDNNQGIVTPFLDFHVHESTRSVNAQLLWGDSHNGLTSGVEYEHGKVQQWESIYRDPADPYIIDKQKDAIAAYANGTISIGDLTVLPGLRYDHTGYGDDLISYSLGATYQLTEKTLLRGYFANGFGLPVLGFYDNGPQRVWTVQSGIETEAVPYLWLKGTLFYNDITNATVTDFDLNNPGVTDREQIKQGFGLEARTTSFHGFSLAGGYTYIDARDRESGKRLQGIPPNLLKASLQYDEKNIGLKGILTANYVDWNAPTDGNAPRYSATIMDLFLTQRIFSNRSLAPEIFFSVRNLFDSSQYQVDKQYSVYKNAPRWIEGGVRFSF